MKTTETPRGIRNNNPLNLRKSKAAWFGKKADGTDPDFEQFDNMYNGIRAALVNIRTMVRVHGCTTVEDVIRRWAPASENDTEAYIRTVCTKARIRRTDKVLPNVKDNICKLAWAMAYVENGQTLDYHLFTQAFFMM